MQTKKDWKIPYSLIEELEKYCEKESLECSDRSGNEDADDSISYLNYGKAVAYADLRVRISDILDHIAEEEIGPCAVPQGGHQND